MSTHQDPITLKRLAWLTALEDPKNLNRQTHGVYQGVCGKVCAVGLLMELVGDANYPSQLLSIIDYDTMGRVQVWNDNSRLTFPKIAARLRKRWEL